MNIKVWSIVVVGLCLAAAWVIGAPPAVAQTGDVKEKPPLYTYAASWVMPRSRWNDMAKEDAADNKVLDRALGGSGIIAYGHEEMLVHSPEGPTHTSWWCAMSEGGLFNTLDEFYKGGTVVDPVLSSATKHWDNVYVSRFYNLRSGSVKGGYVHGSVYKLKDGAPDDSVSMLSKSFIVPFMDKLVADGTVQAYQVAEEAIHTADPDQFFVFFVTPKAEGLDKVNAGLAEALHGNPLAGAALGSIDAPSAHRDDLGRGDSVFK
jgi:hypothetical protein